MSQGARAATEKDATVAGRRYALVGNPNAGKSTLFNRLCGVRTHTANFPGSTVSARIGTLGVGDRRCEIVDLPGHYGLNLDRPASILCKRYFAGELPNVPPPDAVIVVADATNLPRHLIFISQAVQQGVPAVVALTRIDLAQRRGLSIDEEALQAAIGCPVIEVCGRTGEGVDRLIEALDAPRITTATLPDPTSADAAARWADVVAESCVGGDHAIGRASDTVTDRLDLAFTHPVLGTMVFAALMVALFYAIFTLAAVPMDLIDLAFAHLGGAITNVLPDGPIRDLLANGVVGGVAGTLVFLPQICLLFFLITLLEDSGYLARAAFVMDRLLRHFGLPGQSFVPLLSAHACAIPAIMSARLIPGRRDRIATILVAPFLSCSARLPVYVLLIGMLFRDRPWAAGLAFVACYALGAVAALGTSLLVRRTILRGASTPMILELPPYSWPSLKTALVTTLDRAFVFLRKAGTTIVAICIVLWWLGEYPRVAPPPDAQALVSQAAEIAPTDPDAAAALEAEAAALTDRHAKANSFVGRLGRAVEPVFRPLGYDAQLTVGVLSSFLAREVFVSTMTVVVAGSDADPAEDTALLDRLEGAKRADGTDLFTTPTAASLLVFYVLAMQCLPTVEITRRETGNWRWALLQLAWMSGVAYVAAFITYRLAGGA